MKLSEIYKIADQIAPKALSDELCAKYGAYDNSGVLVDTGEDVNGILFTLDLTFAAIDEAIEKGVKLIITHHPVIYGRISDIRDSDDKLLGKKLVRCIANGISIISMHLNLDVAQDGIDESLMNGILRSAGETTGAGMRSVAKMQEVSQGAYGRVYDVKQTNLGALCENMKAVFSSDRMEVYGDKNQAVCRVASFCGAGGDESGVLFAKRQGADVIVSSDFKHHVLVMAQEMGLAVIVLTHYASENYGFKKYYEKMGQAVGIPCYFHTDDNLL